MNYNSIECPVCNEKFNEHDDVVVCPVCGTPHHRSCWQKNGRCINEEKHVQGFIWQMPETAVSEPVNSQSAGENLKTCPRCGEKNAVYEPVCTRCGERLKANSQTIFDKIPFGNDTPFGNGQQNGMYGETFNPNNFSPYQNVYAADARTVYGEDTKIDDIPVAEIAEYIQKDSTKYIGKFLDMEQKKSKLSWNWSSGIFSVFWCFYRKMMGCGMALVAIFFSCYFLSSVISPVIYEKLQPETYAAYEESVVSLADEMQNAINSGVITDEYYDILLSVASSPVTVTTFVMIGATFLLTSVIFGFFGNYFYRKKTVKDIVKIRQVAVDSMSYHMYIKHRGGVSVANIIVPIFVYMMINMMTGFIG